MYSMHFATLSFSLPGLYSERKQAPPGYWSIRLRLFRYLCRFDSFSLLACERVRAHLPELEYEDIRRLHAAVSAFSACL